MASVGRPSAVLVFHGVLDAALPVRLQLLRPEVGALHAVEPVDRIDHRRLGEGPISCWNVA